ncbi:MmcQ/YjbR family DNA-binding protein [Halovulum sp. GXIMD14793]
MSSDMVDKHCAALPGTTMVVQWEGCHVWKVGGKVFAISAPEAGRVSVKCDSVETAEMLIEVGAATKAPHLPRGGWVAVEYATPVEDLTHRLDVSYRTIKAGLPKKLQAEIDG